jgi:hypothetical protein
MTSPGRYRNEPADILDTINRLKKRIEVLEANPRAGNTTIDAGTFRVRDATGNVRLQMGLLSDGTYGIEVLEDGADVFHQVPYIFSDSVDAFEGTTSGTFTDLLTPGPAVTVPVRSTGRVLVLLSTQIQWPASGFTSARVEGGDATIEVSGANTITTAVAALKLLPMHAWNWSLSASGPGTFSDTSSVTSASAAVFDGLNPGNTTFTAKYLGTATTTEFGRRNLTVFAL